MSHCLNDVLAGGHLFILDDANGAGVKSETQEDEDHCKLNGASFIPLKRPGDLTNTWLGSFLNRQISKDGFVVSPIGAGHMSNTVRVAFHAVDLPHIPETIIVKFSRTDTATRELGLRFGHYHREAIFYRRFGDMLSPGLPHCYGAIVDKEAWFTIGLEDLSIHHGYDGDQLKGCDYQHAALALKTLALLQGPLLGDKELDGDKWLNVPPALDQKLFSESLPVFRTKYNLEPAQDKLLDWMAQNLDLWWAARHPPYSIFHGDYRLDNVLFLAKDHDRAVAFDWGGVSWASPMRDVAYFLGNGLTITNRRKWEKDLVRGYLNEVNSRSKVKMSWEHAWKEYRLASLYGLAQHIPAAATEELTEPIEYFFNTIIPRQAQHAIDMDAATLVVPDILSISARAVDEEQHPTPKLAGSMWSESWYFDCVSSDGEVGFYARLGRLPNQNCSNFMGGILRRNRDPVMFIDMHAPLPASDPVTQTFSTERFTVESRCLKPLEEFSLSIRGVASSFTDSGAPYRGETGTEVDEVDVDLFWATAGIPYQKSGLTRYEFPCRVSGNIRIGNDNFSLEGVPGERNHSWGVRNWWVTDWVWSGIHFSDGMDVFTIALGRGAESSNACGAIQQNGKLTEITHVINEFEPQANGFPGNLKLLIEPGNLVIDCEVIEQIGIPLLDPEGRQANLPRSMCKATTNHGQTGVGWLDFNMVINREPADRR